MSRTTNEIRAEIAAARGQMADGVRGLASQVHPSVIKAQTTQQVKDAVAAKVNQAKSLLVDDAGVRWDRVGTVVLAAAGVLTARGALRGVWHWLRR